MWLTEQEVSLALVKAEDRQGLAARSELPVRKVFPWVDQFDQAPFPAGSQDTAELSGALISSGHRHRRPGQREELLRYQT